MDTSILVVDSQSALRTKARTILERAGFRVTDTPALWLGAHERPAVLLVSWASLSPLDESLSRLKHQSEMRGCRIIVMAKREDLTAAINALEFGADDCITEPFEDEELLARVNACLRRPSASTSQEKLTAGPIVLDRCVHQVLVNDSTVELAPTEFRLMAFLLENPGRVFSRTELLSRAWRDDIRAGQRTVDVHVRRLRQQLEPFGCENIIQTVRGFGYRLRVEP